MINKIIDIQNDDNMTIDRFVNSCILSVKRDKVIGDAVKFFYESIKKDINQFDGQVEKRLLSIRDAIIGMVLVSIISSTEEDSYTIFEILNARGQELEQHEF